MGSKLITAQAQSGQEPVQPSFPSRSGAGAGAGVLQQGLGASMGTSAWQQQVHTVAQSCGIACAMVCPSGSRSRAVSMPVA